MYLTIKFLPFEVKIRNIDQGLMVIPTTDGKYILVNFTIDGDFAEIYDDLKELIKKVKEYYGDDIAKVVINELREYYGDDIVENETIQN
ncbi:hypothetical protein AZ270_gp18 [Acidianus tailed spindle virus]|uniref:hypothetical protein n=1 Tax=Acidianus tailed spindle virus TaxID=1797140 RepID=UPI00076F33D0|nr:hypothetical protein AZ270_gp18 [Acidianus tailed spindle virus]AME30041.1 hypothetical protein ATSV_D88 [Acidianus tailed spindle virus]